MKTAKSDLRSTTQTGRPSTGVVVENMITTDFENSRLVHPIVEFSTLEGRRLRVQCVWSTQVKFPVGTTVQVYYDSACPEKAGIVGEGRTGAFLLIGFGATVFVFGLLWLATAMVATAVGR